MSEENTFHIWYYKNGLHPSLGDGYYPYESIPTALQLAKYYSKVREMPKTGLNLIFRDMNIGAWNEDRDNQIIVKALGTHTSMSIGDLVHDTETNIWYKCDQGGWTKFQMKLNGTVEVLEDNSEF